ncbi:hypothetical protein [Acetobacterium tundrae]|uniref:hypothetical protein n=1 Tax=Acetobacterium tundrae TaxID=132932 RepID=UPI0011E05F46|nr:hypothetical protein [Acetobacterium tundrae]
MNVVMKHVTRGDEKMKRIITLGLDQYENFSVIEHLSSKEFSVVQADYYADLIFYQAFLCIINPGSLENEVLDDLTRFYLNVADDMSMTIIFIKEVRLPQILEKEILAYRDFSELESELENVITSAYQKYLKKNIVC